MERMRFRFRKTYKATSRLRSSSTSTSIVWGYVTERVSVQGNEGSRAIVARIRSSATYSARHKVNLHAIKDRK